MRLHLLLVPRQTMILKRREYANPSEAQSVRHKFRDQATDYIAVSPEENVSFTLNICAKQF